MKVKLQITKNRKSLYEGMYDVTDSESFGDACADAWLNLREGALKGAPNIGALMDVQNEDILERLNGAEINLTKL
jgi:hypothetical protein